MKKIRIIVVDDHKLVREMWAKMFNLNENIEIVGESGEFEDAMDLIKKKRPDVVLLDINLNQASGLDAVPLIRKYSPGTKIIAVSMHTELAYTKKMLQLGAKGYVTKNSSYKEIDKAITEAMEGKIYICSEIKEILSARLTDNDDERPNIGVLSLREIEIIKLIKDGFSSKEIASQLQIAARTVEVHRHNILRKLKLKNSVALINFIHTVEL